MNAGESVLLVEDDEGLRGAYRLVLEFRGFHVRDAATLEAALGALGDGPVDAVVADLGLPDAGGPETAAALGDAAPAAALVVLTGHDDAALEESCLAAGATAFRVKPLTGSELADLVDELLSGS